MSESTASPGSWNDGVIKDFRAGEQRIAGMFDRSALLLLHTTGARSGSQRTTPLAYLPDGDRILIVASAAGSPKHPAWYFNLLANPRVQVELWDGDTLDSFEALAVPAEGDERDQLFAQIVAKAPGFGEYQKKTDRIIPVVILTRV